MTSGAVAALLAIKFHAFAASGCAVCGAGKGFEPVQHGGRWRGVIYGTDGALEVVCLKPVSDSLVDFILLKLNLVTPVKSCKVKCDLIVFLLITVI